MDESFQLNNSFLYGNSELNESRLGQSGERFFASLNSIHSVNDSQALADLSRAERVEATTRHRPFGNPLNNSLAPAPLQPHLPGQGGWTVTTSVFPPSPSDSQNSQQLLPQPTTQTPLAAGLVGSSVLLEQIASAADISIPDSDLIFIDLPPSVLTTAPSSASASHPFTAPDLSSVSSSVILTSIRHPHSSSTQPDSASVWHQVFSRSFRTTSDTAMMVDETASPSPSTELQSLDQMHDRGLTVTSASKDVWGVLLSLSPEYPTVQLIKRTNQTDTKRGYLLGRHRECDIQFQHPQVSNRHCLISTIHTEGIETPYIEDLSTNGTFINGERLGRHQQHQLHDGDVIKLTMYATASHGVTDNSNESFIFQDIMALRRGASGEGQSPFHSNYLVRQHLGAGHFANVYIAVNRLTGEQFAVKVIDKKRYSLVPRGIATARAEFGIMMSMHHPCIISIHGVYDEEDSLYMILEYARDGELFDAIVQRSGFTEQETRTIFFQLFMAIKYLHDRGVVHRDLKPENIMLTNRATLRVKITDFGFAKVVQEDAFMKTLCGTPLYVAPEILAPGHERAYSKAVDMWSLGVILYICLCGFPPFSDELVPVPMQQQIKNAMYSFPSPRWDKISDEAKHLVSHLLQKSPESRLTVDDALRHPWMQTRFTGSTYVLDSLPFTLGLGEEYERGEQTQMHPLTAPTKESEESTAFSLPPSITANLDPTDSFSRDGEPLPMYHIPEQSKRKRDDSSLSHSSQSFGLPRKVQSVAQQAWWQLSQESSWQPFTPEIPDPDSLKTGLSFDDPTHGDHPYPPTTGALPSLLSGTGFSVDQGNSAVTHHAMDTSPMMTNGTGTPKTPVMDDVVNSNVADHSG
ncbi:serine/threonine protein kinase [Dispira simplex]|nr:serine/threonine protein kinase [Dispira simplex]